MAASTKIAYFRSIVLTNMHEHDTNMCCVYTQVPTDSPKYGNPLRLSRPRVPAYLKYGKRQETLKSNSEWRTARHRSPRNSPLTAPFAEPFPIIFFQCSLFKVRYSMFAEPFPFAAPFIVAFQCRLTLSLLKSMESVRGH